MTMPTFLNPQYLARMFAFSTFSTICFLLSFTSSAAAFTLNKWDYSIDSFNDSSGSFMNGSGSGVGSQTYFEIFGSAVQQVEGKTRIAILSNMTLGGVASQDAQDGKIYWGDVIINIGCQALDAVNGSLFGIHFDSGNDSLVNQIGFYADVTAFNLAEYNGNPGSNLTEHSDWVKARGGDPRIGIFDDLDPYFNQNAHVPTLIQSGNLIGAITMIEDTSTLGLDYFDNLGGFITAFEFDSNFLPNNQTICYHFGPECNNDIHAGSFETVPTPAAVLPVLSGIFAAAKRKRKEDVTF